jgi:DNA-binding beta-propeller fold protein YncE
MILILDKKAHILGHIGKRGGGSQPGEFRYPSRIAILGDDLYVLDSGNSRIQVLDLSGHVRRQIPLAEANLSDGITVDAKKNIYVTDNQINTVNIFDRNGQFVHKFGIRGAKAGEFNQPSGLWIDSAHRNLYVADTGNHRVQMFEIPAP